MNDITELKAGDTILIKCKVEAVFPMSQMVMVSTRDCDQGFDAYSDEIVWPPVTPQPKMQEGEK